TFAEIERAAAEERRTRSSLAQNLLADALARRSGRLAPSLEVFIQEVGAELGEEIGRSFEQALMEETRKWFHSAAPAAVEVDHDVLTSEKARDVDKLRAADAVMARVDPVTTSQVVQVNHEHRHTHTLTADEIVAHIAALAAKIGIEPAMLAAPVTIDAAVA